LVGAAASLFGSEVPAGIEIATALL
jgi:hypothetical protein